MPGVGSKIKLCAPSNLVKLVSGTERNVQRLLRRVHGWHPLGTPDLGLIEFRDGRRNNLDAGPSGGPGEASVELCNAEGHPLPGFTHADCDRVDLNHLAHTVTWCGQSTLALLPGQSMRLEVRMNSTQLYTMAFAGKGS